MATKKRLDFTKPLCFTILDGSDVYGTVLTANQKLAECLWDLLNPHCTSKSISTPHISAPYSIKCLYDAVVKAEKMVGSNFLIDSSLVFKGDKSLTTWLQYLQELGESELTIDFPLKSR